MSMLAEFKEFAVKGNVVDMAVGVVMGTAFGKVVSSFLDHVMMPPLGLATGGVDFSELRIVLKAAEDGSKAVTLDYGAFITTLVEFTMLAFAVFLMVKAVNRLRRARPAPPPAPSEKQCPECLLNIPLQARRCGHCSQPQQV